MLSISSKVFRRILLGRIYSAVDRKLKQERKGLHISDIALRVINTIPDAPVTVNTDCLDYVEEFTYLGSLSKNNAVKRDIRAMLAASFHLKV